MRAKEALFHPPDVFPGMEKPLFCVFFRARVKNTPAAKKTTKVVALKRAAAVGSWMRLPKAKKALFAARSRPRRAQ